MWIVRRNFFRALGVVLLPSNETISKVRHFDGGLTPAEFALQWATTHQPKVA